jgi:hypothetical protein
MSSFFKMSFQKILIKGVLATSLLSPVLFSAEASAETENPIRWVTGGAVWSTPQEAMKTFLARQQIGNVFNGQPCGSTEIFKDP